MGKPINPVFIYAAAYLVLFCTWAGIVFAGTQHADAIVSYIHDALMALSGHVFTVIIPKQRAGGDA